MSSQSPARPSTGTLTTTAPSGNRTRARGRGPSPGLGTLAPPALRSRQRRPARQWRRPARSASVPASPLPRWPALPADTSPPAGPKRSGNARISRSSGSAKTAHPGRSASTGTARAASPTSNAAPLNARTAATALSSPAPSPVSSASTIRTSPRRSAPGSPATDGNSNPSRYAPPTAIAPRTDSGSCTNPRHRPTSIAAIVLPRPSRSPRPGSIIGVGRGLSSPRPNSAGR